MARRQVDCPGGGLKTSRFRGNDEDGPTGVAPAWVTEFLATLIVTGGLREAVSAAGIDLETAWALREREPEFAMYWDRAMRVHKGVAAGLSMLDAAAKDEASVH